MISIRFEINGREVSANQLGSVLEKAILEGVQEMVTKKVGDARCPEHGQAPSIVCKGRTLEELHFEVHGCCKRLVETVNAKLSS